MIKDSGKRQQLPGMVRDTADDKIDYSLVLDGPLFERLARHLTEGAKKYSKRNWMGAKSQEEYDRFRESLLRHFVQYLRGDTDEDHFAAVAFNLNGMEYVRIRLAASEPEPIDRRKGAEDRRVRQVLPQTMIRRISWRPGRRKGDTFTKSIVSHKTVYHRRVPNTTYIVESVFDGRTGPRDRRSCAHPNLGRRLLDYNPYATLPPCKDVWRTTI